jgi:hypothetical protein
VKVEEAIGFLEEEFPVEEKLSASAVVVAIDTRWDSNQRLFVAGYEDVVVLSAPVSSTTGLSLAELVAAHKHFGFSVVAGMPCLRHIVLLPNVEPLALRVAAVEVALAATMLSESLKNVSSS